MVMTTRLLASLALALGLAMPAQATTQDDVLAAELLSGWQTRSGTHMAALRMRLAPEWKTYWRSPGDTGIPPLFDWSRSENLQGARIHWPVPDVFHLNGMQTIGYRERVVIPVEVTPIDPSRPVVLRARIDLGVCRDICMPAVVELEALLDVPGAPDPEINAALADRPATAPEAGLSGIACSVEPIEDGLKVTAVMDLPAPRSRDETVVFEPGRPDIWVAEAQSRRQGDRLVAVTEMVGPSGAPFALDRSAMTLTVLAGGEAVEIRGCPAR